MDKFKKGALYGKKGFKYEAGWVVERECENIIEEEWNKWPEVLDPVSKVQDMLSRCSGALTR